MTVKTVYIINDMENHFTYLFHKQNVCHVNAVFNHDLIRMTDWHITQQKKRFNTNGGVTNE